MKTTKTDKILAKRWKTTPRTVSRWRTAGAPLKGPDDVMRAWLAGQRTLPAGTRAILETHTPARNGTATAPVEQGAAHTLSRLEQREAEAHEALSVALEGGDAGRIRVARVHWLALTRELRAFDESVAEFRRKAGDHVDRREVQKAMRWLCAIWSSLCGSHSHAACAELASESDPAVIVSILREYFVNRLCHSLAAFGGRSFGEREPTSIPKWLVDAAAEGFSTTSFAAGVGPGAERLRGVMELLVNGDDAAALEGIRQ